MRVSILKLDTSYYEFIWSFHHILMDGWCIGILNNEFFQIYAANLQGGAHALPPVRPYNTYIQWLEKQDKDGFLGDAETLLILMQQHNMKEEQIVYPMAERLLSTGQEQVIAEMENL